MEQLQHSTDDLEHYRPRLFGVAYRMLGDAAEAEDIVQEAYLRWQQADRTDVRAPEGWLVAVVTRLAIDRLRRLETERRAYAGPWLPEPIATERVADNEELASDLSLALLVLLERLGAEERAAFLLREVFEADYDEIARVLEASVPAVRQMVHRARERVRGGRSRFAAPPDARERLLGRFLAALEAEDRDALLAVFAPDATFTSDGGGRVPAARNVLRGPDRITRFLLGIQRKYRLPITHEVRSLNGEPAIASYAFGHLYCVTAIDMDGDRISAVYRVLNPEKLRYVE
ncbi:RNA polymerase sigma factor, sigma-70 family [Gemmatirosa kalamazoonensis]|uniref:RNA polymerase sigma factor, sigma-70 family n=1 Tax=Gemmatirosa kalamazoonensis TaxID=861299 RepID=W0RD31_9BACT|nr:RNA polymerase sigma factor SigJ [Gemmatirosa kalamazoonensis]AHG89034.1 RNA polymerase sigma factor, sigma-70 family [Gemmatirosa kalamazoonensis]